MSEKVFITGQGIISAIGDNTQQVLNSILTQKSGIGFSQYVNTMYQHEIPVAEVRYSNEELLSQIPAKNQHFFRTRNSLLAYVAVKEALESAHIQNTKDLRTGLISSTSVGGMDKTEIFFKDYLKNPSAGRMKNVAGHDCGDSAHILANHFGITHFVTTISTACSSSANAIMLGARLIKQNMLDRVIVGGVDSLTKFTINGFNTLMILDREACRPFDDTRSGLNIGEGAAYLVLESEKILQKFPKKVLGMVSGYGNACDAFHQTASSPEGTGPRLAMEKALSSAKLNPSQISYVNVHGTGTPNNDLSEGKAMEILFEGKVPPFSSTKSFTGHTLGAAGSIEAVVSLLSIEHQFIPPNLNFKYKIQDLTISPESQLIRNVEINHILSNSFGFGGNNTSLVFSKSTE